MLPVIHSQIGQADVPISGAHGFDGFFYRKLFGLVLATVLIFPALALSQAVVNTLSSADVASRLQGKIGGNRAAEIAAIAPLLKAGLTAQEAADILGSATDLSESYRYSAIQSIARAKKLGTLGAEAALMLKATTGNSRALAISEIAPYLKTGLTAQEAADILGSATDLSESYRYSAIASLARAKKLGTIGADAALMLKATTGNSRALAISEIAPYLKMGLTAQEAADILGSATDLSESYRYSAIQSIARAKKLGTLGAEAALMLKATTGNSRALAISEIAPYLKTGLTAQEAADILGSATDLSESYRYSAIASLARAKKLGTIGADAALMLKATTGNSRALAISEIAPYLKTGLTAQEAADILGSATDLSESSRAAAIQSIARAKKIGPGLSEGELVPVLAGMTGSSRALALSELVALTPASVGTTQSIPRPSTSGVPIGGLPLPSSTAGTTPTSIGGAAVPGTGVAAGLNGAYYNQELRFGFLVTGNQGIATVSNSPNYKPGDVMLRFSPTGPGSFTGQQLCTDGVFHPVTGTLADDGSIDMAIQGCFPIRYKMVRQGTPAPDLPVATGSSASATPHAQGGAGAAPATVVPSIASSKSPSNANSKACLGSPAPDTSSLTPPLTGQMKVSAEGSFADPAYNNGVKRDLWREHLGTDYPAAGGTPVYAARPGRVVENHSDKDPYQAVVILEHLDQSRTVYGHIASSLPIGCQVAQGAVLGRVLENSKGFSSHLHYGENSLGKVSKTPTQDGWGWGKAPFGVSIDEMKKRGWIDTERIHRWAR